MIQIRSATAQDISQIQSVASESWHATYSGIFSKAYITDFLSRAYQAQDLSSAVRDPNSVFLVAVSGETIVGFCHFLVGTGGTELLRLYLVPQVWREGIGSRLLEVGEEELRKRGVISYGCFVHAKNDSAKRFYLARGFRHVEELDGTEDWWVSRAV